MIIGNINDSITILVDFGSSKAGLPNVGYTLKNTNGTVNVARTTTGVTHVGNGVYTTSISKATAFKGFVEWDTGEGSPVYHCDPINITSWYDSQFNEIPAEVWSISTRTLSSSGEGSIANAVWNQLTTNVTTTNSIGKQLKDNIDAKLSVTAKETTINNLDTKITNVPSNVWSYTSRQLTSFDTLINDMTLSIWSYSNRTLTTLGTLINDIWNHGSRTLTQGVSVTINGDDVWHYPDRTLTPLSPHDGIGDNAITIQINHDGLPSNLHNARCYDTNKKPIYLSQSGSNGQVIFNLDNGNYFIQIFKDGTWSQEKLIIVNSAPQTIIFNTTTYSPTGTLDFKITRDNSNKVWFSGTQDNLKIYVSTEQKQNFVITSCSYILTLPNKTIVNGNTTIEESKCFFLFNPVLKGTYNIEFTVTIGNQIIKDKWDIKVI